MYCDTRSHGTIPCITQFGSVVPLLDRTPTCPSYYTYTSTCAGPGTSRGRGAGSSTIHQYVSPVCRSTRIHRSTHPNGSTTSCGGVIAHHAAIRLSSPTSSGSRACCRFLALFLPHEFSVRCRREPGTHKGGTFKHVSCFSGTSLSLAPSSRGS
jgi:hypothetical protein